MNIKFPCVVFLGRAEDYKQAKVAQGITEWRPDRCVGQIRITQETISMGLQDITLEAAKGLGAKTFLIGISPYETELPAEYVTYVEEAIDLGMDIANPLHSTLGEALEAKARAAGVEIHNFRLRKATNHKGSGERRSGNRILTVGTDCAIGKKYTALALVAELKKAAPEREADFLFCSTGQTGFLISDGGINNDTVRADFITGESEVLTPAIGNTQWQIVEGQGALSHPSFGPGSLGLLYGTQPDYLIVCHEPGRKTMRGVQREVPSPVAEGQFNELVGRVNNSNCAVVAYSLFAWNASEEDVKSCVQEIRESDPEAIIFDPHAVILGYDKFPNHLQSLEASNALVRKILGGDSEEA